MLRYEVVGVYAKAYDAPRGFLGIAIRGALGSALHNIYCINPTLECSKCSRYEACPYARLYESVPRLDPAPSIARKLGAVTNPFTVDVLYSTERGLGYAVNLFGDATDYVKEVLVAILTASAQGIGYSLRMAERRRLRVERITQVEPGSGRRTPVYEGGVLQPDRIPRRPPRSLLAVFAREAMRFGEKAPGMLELEFLSPYRVGDSFKPSFRALIMNLARRYSLLAQYHRAGRPLGLRDARGLARLASTVELVSARHGRLVEVNKRSLTSGERLSYGLFAEGGVLLYRLPRGFWGSPYSRLAAALLLAGRYLHAGKLASAGYGRYVLRAYG